MAEWQRSAAIGYPLIWREFKVLNPIINEMETFRIMDISEYFYETVIKELTQYTVDNTAIELRPGILADQESIAEIESWWRTVLKQRMSLMCVREQSDCSWLQAFSLNIRCSIFDKEPEFKGKPMKWSWALQNYIYGGKSFYKEFGVSEAIIATSSFTSSDFSASIVREEMYKCRRLLCQATGIKLCLACFEIREGQHASRDVATKAGFQEYIRIPYEEVASVDRAYLLHKCEMFQIMYNFYG